MLFKDFKEILPEIDDYTNILIFVEDENGYRPFENIEVNYTGSMNIDSSNQLHLDVSVHKEFRNIYFPNNLTEEEVEDLVERKIMLNEELEEINHLLGKYDKKVL